VVEQVSEVLLPSRLPLIYQLDISFLMLTVVQRKMVMGFLSLWMPLVSTIPMRCCMIGIYIYIDFFFFWEI
jgi:hypothetical protein